MLPGRDRGVFRHKLAGVNPCSLAEVSMGVEVLTTTPGPRNLVRESFGSHGRSSRCLHLNDWSEGPQVVLVDSRECRNRQAARDLTASGEEPAREVRSSERPIVRERVSAAGPGRPSHGISGAQEIAHAPARAFN